MRLTLTTLSQKSELAGADPLCALANTTRPVFAVLGLVRMLEVLTVVAECERREDRLATIERHASLVLADALRSVPNEADRMTVRGRADRFSSVVASRRLAKADETGAV